MLNKFFKVHKLGLSRDVPPKVAAAASSSQPESSSALRIGHAGGFVECYHSAIAAVRILETCPSCVLARPEVFRRPWDSVVRSDRILTPGEKFFLVPRHTIKKLRRRIAKPDREVSSNSFISKSSIDISVDQVSRKKDDFLGKSLTKRSGADYSTDRSASFSSALERKLLLRQHVSFTRIDEKYSGKVEDDPRNKSSSSRHHGVKRRPKNSPAAWQWQPSLSAICERTVE